jgi:hypothetical protein
MTTTTPTWPTQLRLPGQAAAIKSMVDPDALFLGNHAIPRGRPTR